MPEGPGKYDDLATMVRERSGGGVIVVVINGARGSGFSVQIPAEVSPRAMVDILRGVARDVEDVIGKMAQ